MKIYIKKSKAEIAGDKLAKKRKRAYTLYMGTDLSYRELARVFEVSQPAVQDYVDRGEKLALEDRRIRNAK